MVRSEDVRTSDLLDDMFGFWMWREAELENRVKKVPQSCRTCSTCVRVLLKAEEMEVFRCSRRVLHELSFSLILN